MEGLQDFRRERLADIRTAELKLSFTACLLALLYLFVWGWDI